MFYKPYNETPTKGMTMSQDNIIALIIGSSCGALAAAFLTEYLYDRFRKIIRRIKN